MITGIQDVYYNVQDMDRAERFYTEVLNFKKIDGNPHWISLELSGMRVGLHWSGGDSVPTTPRDPHGQHCGASGQRDLLS